jgi:hypothetical protein
MEAAASWFRRLQFQVAALLLTPEAEEVAAKPSLATPESALGAPEFDLVAYRWGFSPNP